MCVLRYTITASLGFVEIHARRARMIHRLVNNHRLMYGVIIEITLGNMNIPNRYTLALRFADVIIPDKERHR